MKNEVNEIVLNQTEKYICRFKKGACNIEQEKYVRLVSGSALDGFLYRAFWWNRLLAANNNFIKIVFKIRPTILSMMLPDQKSGQPLSNLQLKMLNY